MSYERLFKEIEGLRETLTVIQQWNINTEIELGKLRENVTAE